MTGDDQHFLFARLAGAAEDRTRTVVVEHWTEELKVKMGGDE